MFSKKNSNVLLSDQLERRLIEHALSEQQRFQPINAVKNWIKRISA